MRIERQWQEPLRGHPEIKFTVRKAWFPSQADQAGFLRALVNRYREFQVIKNIAANIILGNRLPPKQTGLHALAIARWLQLHIFYLNEAPETFQTPIRTLICKFADCDDFSTLLAALLESIGIPTRLVLLHWKGGYRHIFVQALVTVRGKAMWLNLDPTLSSSVYRLENPIAKAVRKYGPNVRTLSV